MKYRRIMLAGPSGFGKTTLARWISDEYHIPFQSGSVSDLIPDTRSLTHEQMLNRGIHELYQEDYKVVNLRNKLLKSLNEFVTDRSYIDSAAYFLYKQAGKSPDCDIEHFLEICKELLVEQADIVFFLNFDIEHYNEWEMEDNHKRITSKFFQIQVSSLMSMFLRYIRKYQDNGYVFRYGYLPFHLIESNGKQVKVVEINTTDFNERTKIIKRIL